MRRIPDDDSLTPIAVHSEMAARADLPHGQCILLLRLAISPTASTESRSFTSYRVSVAHIQGCTRYWQRWHEHNSSAQPRPSSPSARAHRCTVMGNAGCGDMSPRGVAYRTTDKLQVQGPPRDPGASGLLRTELRPALRPVIGRASRHTVSTRSRSGASCDGEFLGFGTRP